MPNRTDYFRQVCKQLVEERAAKKLDVERAQAAWEAAPVGSLQRDIRKKILDGTRKQYERVQSRAAAMGLPPEGADPSIAAEVPKGNQKNTSHDQGKQDAANVPAATEDPYVEKLSKIDPVDLGTYWGAFQCEPRGPLWKIGNFQTERHLLNTYRPADAQGLAAALAHRAYGKFLDQRDSAPTTAPAATAVLNLVGIASDCYQDLNNAECKAAVQEALGPPYLGPNLAEKGSMLQKVREELLRYLLETMRNRERLCSEEPSKSGASESCELLRLEKNDGSASKITILFMEGREDFGLGGASNPTMEMCGHYSQRSVKGLANTSAWAETMLPAVGVEVIGQAFRVNALFLTNKVCCEPLTEWLHLADLRNAQSRYMEKLVRMLHALGELCDDLCDEMRPYAEALVPSQSRKQQLKDGIPFMLHSDRHNIEELPGGKLVYLCSLVEPSAREKPFVAKFLADPYPVELHEQLSAANLTAELLGPIDTFSGGWHMVKMAYLSREEGWVSLYNYKWDVESLAALAEAALATFHTCLNNKAVHGDLSAGNIFVRMAEAADGDAEDNRAPTQIAILDLAWAGTEGKTRYPPFVNPKALRNIKQVDGQLIMQERDREQLGLNLDRLRTQERNHRDRLSRMAAA